MESPRYCGPRGGAGLRKAAENPEEHVTISENRSLYAQKKDSVYMWCLLLAGGQILGLDKYERDR